MEVLGRDSEGFRRGSDRGVRKGRGKEGRVRRRENGVGRVERASMPDLERGRGGFKSEEIGERVEGEKKG